MAAKRQQTLMLELPKEVSIKIAGHLAATSERPMEDLRRLQVTCHLMYVRNVEYSILPVMSELSTVRCDRALCLWIAGTRASSVDGELPWRSSGRATAMASTPGSRVQAATEGGFLGLRHKTKQADGG